MAIKLDLVKEMIDVVCENVTQSEDTWRDFLKYCAYMYKYDFGNQLAIYAQKPESIACAGYETWIKLGRYVKRGSKGIRLVNRSDYADKGYVFDVSDTARLDGNNRFTLWQADQSVIEQYLKGDGIQYEEPFTGLLAGIERESIIHFADYASVLLEQTQEKDVQEIMGKIDRLSVLASMSSSYVILHRCGVDIDDMQFDFSALSELSEMKDFRAFGEVLYNTQTGILRKLEVSAKKTLANHENILYDENRKETNVRTVVEGRDKDGTDLQTGRGLPGSEHRTAAAADGRSGDVRTDERPLPRETPAFPVVGDEYRGNAETASAGHRPGRGGTERSDAAGSAGEIRRNGGTESKRSDGMGAQSQPDSRHHPGTDPKRPGLRLEEEDLGEQLTFNLFPMEAEQKEKIIQSEKDGDMIKNVPSFLVPQEVVDAVLISLPTKSTRLMLCADHEKQLPVEKLVQRLRKEWQGGSGIVSGGEKYAVWADDEGLAIAHGTEVCFNHAAEKIPWDVAAARVSDLLDVGIYLDADEYSQVAAHDYEKMAAALWYMRHDMSEDAVSRRFLPALSEQCRGVGYPDATMGIMRLLKDPKERQLITEEVRSFAQAYREEPALMRWSQYSPTAVLPQLEDLGRERRAYQYRGGKIPHADSLYISDDEIDAELMRGGNVAGSFGRIQSFFGGSHTLKEKADYIKDIFGVGGHSGPAQIGEWHDAKGIKLQKKGCDEVRLTWQQAATRMDALLGKLQKEQTLPAAEEEHKAPESDTPSADISITIGFTENSAVDRMKKAFPEPYTFAFANRLFEELDRMYSRAGQVYPDEPAFMGYDKTDFRLFFIDSDGELAEYVDRYDIGSDAGSLLDHLVHDLEMKELLERLNEAAKAPLSGDEEVALKTVLMEMQEWIEERAEPKRARAVPLEDASLRLYQKFAVLAPEVLSGEAQSVTLSAGAHDMDLCIERLDDTHVSMTHYFEQNGDLVSDPDIEFVIDRENKTLTPIAYTNDIQGKALEVMDEYGDMDEQVLKELNGYCLQWFENLQQKGYGRQMLLDRKAIGIDEELDKNPTSVIIDGRWQTFENAEAANAAWDRHRQQAGTEKSENEAQNEILSEEKLDLHTPDPEKKKQAETAKFYLTDDALGTGTVSEKFQANIKAIQTLKGLEEEKRAATEEERNLLSRYVGWGGLAQIFKDGDPRNTELQTLLTEEEYRSARESVLNAHYTPPVVIDAMYQALSDLGFDGGSILEPACGVGNFFGRMPAAMRELSHLYGVELDNLSGRIARVIYPDAQIQIKGFEETAFADKSFDVAIGNVPFGDYSISDRYGKGYLIHDYFFAAALDKVRPGGVVAFITSSGTLDKKASHVREHLARRADLIGAVRLPDAAFKAGAGTETTTDILFLQKLRELRENLADIGWLHLATDQEGLTYNAYFAAHPEMVVGEMRKVSGPYGDKTVCKLDDMEVFKERLFDAVSHIRGSMLSSPQMVELPEIDAPAEEEAILGVEIPAYSFGTDMQGNLIYMDGEKPVPVTAKEREKERIKGMMEIRDITRQLISAQVGDDSEEELITLRTKLNHAYDRYTGLYGLLHSRENRKAFEKDTSYPLLCSLEEVDEDGKLKRKADMFTRRTIRKAKVVTAVDTPQEALAVSLAEKGCVNIPYMASLAGVTENEIIQGLRSQIYLLPEEDRYVPADEYLSGNIREKLKTAKAYPGFEENVKALEAVMPEPLGPGEINVRLGSTWVPVEVYKQFIFQLLQTPVYDRTFGRIDLAYSESLDVWHIKGKGQGANVLTTTTYGTKRANAYRIIESTMNLRPMQITDEVEDADGNVRRVVNAKETALACEKQELIKEKFQAWIWEDPQRRQRLVDIYNERFNSIRPREYNGNHLSFPGMNPEIALRPHQRRAVARQVYGGNTLLAHAVGAGKTYEIAAAIMERKRLGLTSKAMIVVPNHLIGQWASEFLALYPAANVLAVTKKDFEKSKRREFCARIAASDVDAVIIAHSQFEMIPLSKERQVRFLTQQIDQIQREIEESAKEDDRSFTVKQLVSMEKKLTKKLKDALGASRRDDVIDFEDLGIDFLCVDEAHGYKNLALQTKMRNVAGVSTGGANKSFDMYAKCRYMDEITSGKGITFATGTPVSNSIAELYTMQRYLQYDVLESLGMVTFDRWASTFAESTTDFELAPEGNSYRQKTRFARFFNLPELMSSFKECADILPADMLDLDVPEAEYVNVVLKPSERQKAMISAIGERADAVRGGNVDARDDNMLKITTDGRKLALDERLLPFDDDAAGLQFDLELHQSKVDACTEKCVEIYRQTMEKKSTQLIFCDQSTPKADGSFNVYGDLKEKLMAVGIPEDEIAFIHDADTDAKKQALFAKVRNGSVRILIGSTSKMGAGMNVQNRLIALHHLDVPWKPSDIEQQEGRILRQGNENEKVQIYRYITENTFDAYSWQLIENKQKFISQIMTSKAPARSCEDIDDAVLSAAEAKAQATGDPLIKERIELENDISRLRLSLGNYNNEHYQMKDQFDRILPAKIADLDERITAVKKDSVYLEDIELPEGDNFAITVEGKIYSERTEGGEAIMKAIMRNSKEEKFVKIAEYAGFEILSRIHAFDTEADLKIQRESSMVIESGDSPLGVTARIKNVIQKLPERLTHMEESKAALETDMERIKAQLNAPFEKADELSEKEKRLAELKRKLESRPAKEEKNRGAAEERNTLHI